MIEKNNNKKTQRDTMKCFVLNNGLEVSLYPIEDVDLAKKYYGIQEDDIFELDQEQVYSIGYKATIAGKICSLGNLFNLNNDVLAEKRLNNTIRNLQINFKIEKVLKKFKELSDEQREEIEEETGIVDSVSCDIYSEIEKYAKQNKVSTITVSSVFLFVRAVGDYIQAINLLRNLRRNGIYIHFKNDGLWTGMQTHDFDIGALCVLAICTDLIEEDPTNT